MRSVLWICAVGLAGVVIYFTLQRIGSGESDEPSAEIFGGADENQSSGIPAAGSSTSPFELADTLKETLQTSDSAPDQPGTVIDLDSNVASTAPALDVTTLGREPFTDEEFLNVIERLREDPSAVARLVDEIRQETDPQRLKQLTLLLGKVGGEPATLLASEYIFSGDEELRTLGLDLLQEVQPGNPQARDIVAGMLATEVEPDVLVNTLTTLADPGQVDDQSRQYLSDQVAWLTDHPDASVRSISLDILSRWTNDGTYTDVLLSGLDDESQYVRTSAAYALADHEDRDQRVIDRLFVTAYDSAEIKSVRQAAVLALSRMPLTENQQSNLAQIRQSLNTIRR